MEHWIFWEWVAYSKRNLHCYRCGLKIALKGNYSDQSPPPHPVALVLPWAWL